jgi:hypothetical protein
MNKRLLLLPLALIFSTTIFAEPVPPATNKDGSPVSGILEAAFDPTAAVVPFPTNLFFPQAPPIDLTVSIPGVPNPDDFRNPRVALNSLDGFSTSEKWVTTFTQNLGGFPATILPGDIDAASVVAGQSVRVFEVTTTGYPYLGVTGVVRELLPNQEYAAVAAPGGIVAVVPIMPLKQYTTYMAVMTNDINDARGNDATPSTIYGLTKMRTPLVDENGNSTTLLDDATAQALEPLRQITMSMELSAGSAGVNPADIVMSWTVHTQSIAPVLVALRTIAEPAPTILAPTPLNTSDVGGFGLADIYIGVITLPYYSGIPSAGNPVAPLTDFWKATPGGYIPPFDQIPFLDPTSTNLTVANPFPVPTGMQTVPLLVTVPNETSGFTKPEGGWPVVIYMHGLTRNRTDMLALADSVALTGRVLVAMDQPLHGVVPAVEPQLAPFYIENTPFAPIANERTFDADYWDNETGAPGPDGITDESGRSSFNLANLQATRDNAKQGEADWSILTLSLQNMDLDGDTTPDLNGFGVSLVSHSAGGYLAIPFAAVEPLVSNVYLNATGGGMMRSLNGGHFGPDFVQPFLSALAGIEVGTPEFEQYMIAAQTLIDSADSINWGSIVSARMPVIHNEVLGDDTVPNVVPGAPLAGSEALNRVMGLASYSETQANPDGLRGVARYLQPADHSSLFTPIYPAVTFEMQGQLATFFAGNGTFVLVENPGLLLPVAPPPAEKKAADGKNKAKSGEGKQQLNLRKLSKD